MLNEKAHDLFVDGRSSLRSFHCAGSGSRPAYGRGRGGTWRKARRIGARRRLASERVPLCSARGSHSAAGRLLRVGGGGIWVGTGALVVVAIVLLIVFLR